MSEKIKNPGIAYTEGLKRIAEKYNISLEEATQVAEQDAKGVLGEEDLEAIGLARKYLEFQKSE